MRLLSFLTVSERRLLLLVLTHKYSGTLSSIENRLPRLEPGILVLLAAGLARQSSSQLILCLHSGFCLCLER